MGLLLLLLLLVPGALGPSTLRASSSPSTLFEPGADHPLLGRLTLGGTLSASSHKDSSLAQLSAPAALSCGERGGGEWLPEPVGESVGDLVKPGYWLVNP